MGRGDANSLCFSFAVPRTMGPPQDLSGKTFHHSEILAFELDVVTGWGSP